jgi:glycosyltransferase involved in cell wall biosynthesis
MNSRVEWVNDGSDSIPTRHASIRQQVTNIYRTARSEGGLRWALVQRARELVGIEQVEAQLAELSAVSDRPEADDTKRLRDLVALHDEMLRSSAWAASAPLTPAPRISVILPTLGLRPNRLQSAVDSVLSQNYPNVELLIVGPKTMRLSASHRGHASVRIIDHNELGGSGARNKGLAEATGELIAYLDDDNTMGPVWLRAIAVLFQSDSETDVAYGIRLHQPLEPGSIEIPFLHFERTWDPSVLQDFNPIDTNVLAHRAHLQEAQWNTELPACADWELATRLTAEGRVRPLAVIASIYTTDLVGRVTTSQNTDVVGAQVRSMARERRKVRVLAYNYLYPHLSETYIESELSALSRNGFEVRVARCERIDTPVESEFVIYESFREAVDSFAPELVVIHWASFARGVRDEVVGAGLPYIVRVHSFDLQDAVEANFNDDPWCAGIWAYPHTAPSVPGSHALSSLVHDAPSIPHAPGYRSGVAVLSAALPKKDWPRLAKVLGPLRQVERRVLIATTRGHEDLPAQVRRLFHQHDARIDVRLNVAHQEAIELLTATSMLLYSVDDDFPFGNPRSAIEGWLCGAIVFLPDRPAARAFAGDHARYFTTLEQAGEMIAAFVEGGPELEKERSLNADFARSTFCHPEVHRRFATEVRAAFNRWEVEGPSSNGRVTSAD